MVQVGVRRHAEIGIFRRMIAMTSEAQCLLELLDLFCENATCRVGMPRARRRFRLPSTKRSRTMDESDFYNPCTTQICQRDFFIRSSPLLPIQANSQAATERD